MATSRSDRKNRAWTAGAFLFSGRPDPVWDVPEAHAQKLIKLWESLPAAIKKKTQPSPGGLGYRGSFLKGPQGREWTVFDAAVTLKSPAGSEVRADPARNFEQNLLASAPPDLLPDGLLDSSWAQK